ncbi:TPA: GGDEF domain-containing protein [Vibrio vulnificus]|uniref:sensor domain-containing diguanylate cyclase n=1 Tax=Vibrio vulnificus TaxID=672 RepID=UPI0010232E45|nr:GGDEF domain-containing protein [Vibrio vulnificus]MDS1870639.1 GGDEF domain-containing protein [Vibrio vulnificus]RZP68079.1 GGDEF domain-containing protein [Vibrio vulnificus]RZR15404.1 GGDEF domain-containing protein [Vibrio vulnificus]HDY7666330.1 GGDEF domain-containing protein [Vibrio vulnificus]HDY7671682.1 GGDEF domain-containing protein [Vibrio vulnificus]
MNFRSFMRKVSATRDHRLLAETMFEYLAELMEVDAMAIFDDPCVNTSLSLRFWSGQPAPLVDFPSSFWQWARQFDTSESLIPLAINTCNWDHRDLLGGNSYIMMLDNFPMLRTYILIQGVKAGSADHIYEKTHDAMQLIAARWQCIRAEKQASLEIKNRDIREAQYIDEINHRERFIDNMKLVQEVALEISNPSTLNDLYRKAVEALRDRLGFDRSTFMLLDMKKRCFNGTYGTDEHGNTVSEFHTQYDLHQLGEEFVTALSSRDTNLVISNETPLYTAGKVVGQGWNLMLILRDGHEPFGWLALDNFIHRKPITSYQKQMLQSFGSLLSQIYIRKRQEQNVRMLHSSMVELSRCTTVSDVCKSAVSFAIQHLGVDRMAVFLTDENCTYMQGTWGTDIQGNVVDESYFFGETQDFALINLARSMPNEVAFEDSVPIYHDCNIVGFGWGAMTLLTSNTNGPIAFIAVDNLLTRSPLTSQLREVIRMFASSLAEVLQRTQAQEAIRELNENLEKEVRKRTQELEEANRQLEVLSKLDPLTRLGNRRMLEHVMESICHSKEEKALAFGLILIDIDHFGLFNNHYGHLEGDIALMRIGHILEHHSNGKEEVFCRIGGEEFVMLMVGSEASGVLQRAECIRQCIEQEQIKHQVNPNGDRLTVSIGVAVDQVQARDLHFDKLYQQADVALYRAKAEGRNRVCSYQSLSVEAI